MILLLAAILPALATGDAPPHDAVKLSPPRVEYRVNEASATTSPWIDANGWQIVRSPDKHFYYDLTANDAPRSATTAALAAAEAFAYGARAEIRVDKAAAEAFNRMLEFLKTIPESDLPTIANIGVVDDGSDEAGELMNMLSRRNILYKIVKGPERDVAMTVRLGTKEYPMEEAADPSVLAQKIRAKLGDEHRSLRIYGSEVVIARLLGNGERARVHLLNYSNRGVAGLRVRVAGNYRRQNIVGYGKPGLKLQDVAVGSGATEFTVPDLGTYAVVDLWR
jgi:hypothetical protein